MVANILTSILVVSFSSGFIYAIVESIKSEKRRQKLVERKVKALEKIAGIDSEKETK